MEYNKNRFYKYKDKRVLHKVKKQWIIISLALLATLGSKVIASHSFAHASVNNKTTVNMNDKRVNPNAKSTLQMKNKPKKLEGSLSTQRPASVSQAANHLHQSILRNSLRFQTEKTKHTLQNNNLERPMNGHLKTREMSSSEFRTLNTKLKYANPEGGKHGITSGEGEYSITFLNYNPSNKKHPGDAEYEINNDKPDPSFKYTTNDVGQPFNLSQFLVDLKPGYRLKNVIYSDKITSNGSNVPKSYIPGIHQIYLEEYKYSDVPGGYNFRYRDAQNGYEDDGDKDDDGVAGQHLDISGYLNSVPQIGSNGETIINATYMGKTYNVNQFPALEQKLRICPAGIRTVNINFLKNPDGLPEPINVTYRDPDSDNGNFVGSPDQPITGHFFQTFSDITKKVPVPSGYELDPVSRQPAADFTTDPHDPYYHEISNQKQDVTLYVHKKSSKPVTKDIPMYIEYVEYDYAHKRYKPISSEYQFSSGPKGTNINRNDLSFYLDPNVGYIPQGYKNPQLVSGDPNTYNSKNNLVLVSVQPDQPQEITRNYTVEVIKRDKKGNLVGQPSDKTESIKTQIGKSDSNVVNPNNFIPSGYHMDSNDHDQTITVDRNGNLNSNKVIFYYDQNTQPNKPSDMTGQYTVDLYEKQNGQYKLVKTVPKELTGKSDTNWLTPSEFKSLIPNAADYQDANPNQQISVHLDNSGHVIPGIVKFYYDPVNRTDRMTVKYLYNGQQIGNSVPVSGPNGSSFDIRPYLTGQNVPAGYQSATPQAGDPDTFVQNGQVLIDLHKESTQSDTMTVTYKYNGNPVGPSIQVRGKDGTPFNVHPYLARIPSGYTSPSVQPGDPTDYVPNGQVIINLQKPSNGGNGNGGYTPTPMPSPTPSPVPNPTPNPTPNNNGGNNTPVNNGNNTPTPNPKPSPSPKPTPNNHRRNNTPQPINRNKSGNTPFVHGGNHKSSNKGRRNTSTLGHNLNSTNSRLNNARVHSGNPVNHPQQKLPQTGEKQNDADIGNILMMMGATVALLGRALDRRRYNE